MKMPKGLLESFVSQLAQELELTDLASFEGGTTLLHFPDLLDLRITIQERGWLLQTVLGPAPSKERETFFCRALLGNLLGEGTGGSVLALDTKESQMLLLHLLQGSFDYKGFKETLEGFLNYAQLWQNKCTTSRIVNAP